MGLQGANKSAHWDGWEIENPLELYCMHFPYIVQRYKSVKKILEYQERIFDINNDLHIVILNVISSK